MDQNLNEILIIASKLNTEMEFVDDLCMRNTEIEINKISNARLKLMVNENLTATDSADNDIGCYNVSVLIKYQESPPKSNKIYFIIILRGICSVYKDYHIEDAMDYNYNNGNIFIECDTIGPFIKIYKESGDIIEVNRSSNR